MSQPMIQVEGLCRRFGAIEAVRDVSFEVQAGQVVGFIGANGAGKTTTMRIMVTLDLPSSGTVRIAGCDVMRHPQRVREQLGWMPDHYPVYKNVTVWEYLDFFARAYGFWGADRRERVAEVMAFAELAPLAERDMSELSKGMRQRLCLGRALLNDPAILVLDEPAAGLDPKARLEFKELVRLLSADGKTVFISSHILSELGEMCDTLLFIDEGRIRHHGSPESFAAGAAKQVRVRVEVVGPPEALADWAAMQPEVELVELDKRGGLLCFRRPDAKLLADALHRMFEDGLQVSEFRREQARLEDAFVDMLQRAAGEES